MIQIIFFEKITVIVKYFICHFSSLGWQLCWVPVAVTTARSVEALSYQVKLSCQVQFRAVRYNPCHIWHISLHTRCNFCKNMSKNEQKNWSYTNLFAQLRCVRFAMWRSLVRRGVVKWDVAKIRRVCVAELLERLPTRATALRKKYLQ